MSGAIFHGGRAEIATGEPPRLREVGHAIVDVGFGHGEFGIAAAEAEHACGRRHDLHQPDFAGTADRIRIEAALDRHHRFGNRRRETLLSCLLRNQRPIIGQRMAAVRRRFQLCRTWRYRRRDRRRGSEIAIARLRPRRPRDHCYYGTCGRAAKPPAMLRLAHRSLLRLLRPHSLRFLADFCLDPDRAIAPYAGHLRPQHARAPPRPAERPPRSRSTPPSSWPDWSFL